MICSLQLYRFLFISKCRGGIAAKEKIEGIEEDRKEIKKVKRTASFIANLLAGLRSSGTACVMISIKTIP